MKRTYLVSLGILLVAIMATVVIVSQKGLRGDMVACPADAKICPDGSAVGRVGPECEFALCPGELAQEVRVRSPAPHESIGLPLVIRGEARVFENIFGYRLLSSTGERLLQGYIEVAPAPAGTLAPFEVAVNYPDPRAHDGVLEIIMFDEATGVEIEKKEIPVVFASVAAVEVDIYFNNKNKDPRSLLCEKTYPVKRRVAQSDDMLAETVRELLRGPTALEDEMGYMTSLNPNVQLRALTREADGVRVDFNEGLITNVAGSCRVGAIRSQIENTLKQFDGVKSVIISVNGRSGDILQP